MEEMTWYPPLFEGRVLHLKAPRQTSPQGIIALGERLTEALETTPYRHIHLLIDESDALEVPSLQTIVKALAHVPEAGLGWVVLYHMENRFVNMVSHLAGQFLQVRLRIVKTYDEALEFLAEMDEDIARLR